MRIPEVQFDSSRMARFFVLMLFLLAAQAKATLIVVVPTKDGFVVAADSRRAMPGVGWCDDQFKITEVANPLHTVVLVTNATELMFTTEKTPSSNVCQLGNNHIGPVLNFPNLVKSYLEIRDGDINKFDLQGLADYCVDAFNQFLNSHKDSRTVIDPNLSTSINMVTYIPSNSSVLVQHFLLKFDSSTGRAIATEFVLGISPSTTPQTTLAFGENDYWEKNVKSGVGRKFLNPATIKFLDGKLPISAVDKCQAVNVARDIVDATSKTTKLVPGSLGIGGPIDVLFVGSSTKPERIQWKH